MDIALRNTTSSSHISESSVNYNFNVNDNVDANNIERESKPAAVSVGKTKKK